MRATQYLLRTAREDPADAELASHRLMLRSGMVRHLASGLYTWMPLGLRVLHKAAQIVREEMDRAGALEVQMPMVQPAELWRESGRWEEYGPELLRLKDRRQRDFCLGPTHEELVTALVRDEIDSYRSLPLNLYQVQAKFRDELRPRFGVMRAREFLMKDAYSFHADEECLQRGYETMRAAYEKIFTRMGLQFRMVAADSGSIGGQLSHEFHALADAGEDSIVFSDEGDYASNLELAAAAAPDGEPPPATESLREIETGTAASIGELVELLQLRPEQLLKTLLVEGTDAQPVALVLRGDHSLNELKAGRLAEVRAPLQFLGEERVRELLGVAPGVLGPVQLEGAQLIVDRDAAQLADFVCGANVPGRHYAGVNWGRDCTPQKIADLRNVLQGDPSPDGRGRLQLRRGIEVGHIFQLGQKYSTALGAAVDAEKGGRQNLYMGCYGIGVGRSVAAVIEQNHDQSGILWPEALAPFQLSLVALNPADDAPAVRDAAESLYRRCLELGIETLYDDRAERAGVKLNDAELIGIPHRLVIGTRGLKESPPTVEYRARAAEQPEKLPLDQAAEQLARRLQHAHAQS